MKRDPDITRSILLWIEEKCPSSTMYTEVPLAGVPSDVVNYHLGLLVDAGYVKTKNVLDEASPLFRSNFLFEDTNISTKFVIQKFGRKQKRERSSSGILGWRRLVQ